MNGTTAADHFAARTRPVRNARGKAMWPDDSNGRPNSIRDHATQEPSPMAPVEPAILIVDDDRDTCQNLMDILSDRGYRVDAAQDGQAALRLVEEQTYDVALLDLRMPSMDGLTLCRKVIRRRPAMVVLLITGYPEDVGCAEARAAGARQIVPKPLNVPRLLNRIEDLLVS